MNISHRNARRVGIGAIVTVIILQSFNSFVCYHHDILNFLLATILFVGIPLLPAFVSLVLPNPLRAVGACLLFAPWLFLAYYTDCVRPDSEGGASMIYVAVLIWGSVTSLVGALITDFITRIAGIEVTATPNSQIAKDRGATTLPTDHHDDRT